MHALETSKLLTEEYTAKILLATMGRPKSAFELSEKLNIPIAATYRKINVLVSAGLLYCDEKKLTRAGKRIKLYKARIKNAKITFEKNSIRTSIDLIDGTTEDYSYNMDMEVFMSEDLK